MQRKRLVNMLMLAAMIAAPLALAACNTTEGMGRDMERSGEWIQKKANDNK
jgi:predicted small secreted protein